MSTGTSLANPANAGKETIYVDIDDEITTIIDKVRGSSQKIVALVLPKRATMLQSVVNMKLLKRTADDAKKHLVLITTEAGLLPLAGGVGLYVAKNLQSKPEIPELPGAQILPDDTEEALTMDDEKPAAPKFDKNQAVGELAAGTISAAAVEDTIDLDNDGDDDANMPASAPASAKKAKKPKGQFKIPNFNRFRLMLVLGIAALILLIGGWILCFNVLPKASILVKTNASNVTNNVTVTFSTTATAANATTLPAQVQQTSKSYSQQVPATGQKDNGTKASGQVTMTAQECGSINQAPDVPAGTGISSNGLTFITQQNTSFSVNGRVQNHCITYAAVSPTPVLAQNNGDKYNVPAGDFTIAGRSDVTASSSSAMAGGTSVIVKIVQQSDIDGAKQKITSQDTSAIKQQLMSALQAAGLTPIQATFQAGAPAPTQTANAGDQADTVTVSETVNYTMFGAKQTDLHSLVEANVKKQIDTSKQVLLDDGLSQATYTVQSQDASKAIVALQDTAVAGPDLKVDALKPQVAGKKAADAESVIKANPGVTDVSVNYSPFWVSAIPKNTSKITIVIEKPSQNGSGS
ncbi:MAG TPA: hypothetical protein VLG11_01765 [Candidatus Saccharimonadales bacterium]|nr:hypothetical protein [Candidatus Saccharimonadales bacterium]